MGTKKKTVLMIDDDVVYLRQWSNLLRERYRVIMINSAKLALEYLAKHVPDVILLDYQMPLHNGTDMMKLIRETAEGGVIPIIILSGMLSREVRQECDRYHPVAYLTKPVSRETLEEHIELALT